MEWNRIADVWQRTGGSVGRPGLGGYAVLFLFRFFPLKHYNRIPRYLVFEYLLFFFFSHCLSSHVQRSELPNWDSRNLNLPHHFPFSHSPSLSFRSPTSSIRSGAFSAASASVVILSFGSSLRPVLPAQY